MTARAAKDTAWMADAKCAGCDPSLFHNDRGDMASIREAKAICATCPVREACLDYALSFSNIAALGVWGGMTERERRDEKRRRIAAGLLSPSTHSQRPIRHGTTTHHWRRCRKTNGGRACDACNRAHAQQNELRAEKAAS